MAEAAAAGQAAPPVAPAAGTPGRGEVFRRRAEVPPFKNVLSAEGEPLYEAISGISRRDDGEPEAAVLDLGGRGCAMLIDSELNGTAREADLRLRIFALLLGQGYQLRWSAYADRGILNTLAERHVQELDQVEQTEVMREFDRLIGRAMSEGASDIHLTDRAEGTEVALRIHGYLEHYADWPTGRGKTMANAVYRAFGEAKAATFNLGIIATTNMERQVRVSNTGQTERVRLRYTQSPINPNEFYMNVRLLRSFDFTGMTLEGALQRLGYLPEQVAIVREIVARPEGATLVAGETGSGKSTLIKAMLECLNDEAGGRLNIITAEDPPEYVIKGARQIPVDEANEAGITFNKALAVMMRLDGDILMPGEIRDQTSINAVADGALSGHRVMATVHAASAVGIIKRIGTIGAKLAMNPLDQETLASPRFLSGLIHQSLLPRLCDACALTLEEARARNLITPRVERWLDASENEGGLPEDALRFRNPEGCPACSGRGLSGRTACAEVLSPDETFLDLIRVGKLKEAEEHWAATDAGMSAIQVARHKIRQGIVSPEDAANFVSKVLES